MYSDSENYVLTLNQSFKVEGPQTSSKTVKTLSVFINVVQSEQNNLFFLL